MCLPYVKRLFQQHQCNVFFFRAQVTQIPLFTGMPVLERSKTTMEVLGTCLPYVKRYFQPHQWNFLGLPLAFGSKSLQHTDYCRVSEAVSSIIAQNWPCDSQIAVQKLKLETLIFLTATFPQLRQFVSL